MIIRMDSPLPCAMYTGASQCDHPTTMALISPMEGSAWELLALCDAHLQEAVATSNTAPPPLTYAWGMADGATGKAPGQVAAVG